MAPIASDSIWDFAGALLALISLVVAVSVFVTNSINSRNFERRQHTVQRLSKYHEEGPVRAALTAGYHWQRTGRRIDDCKVDEETHCTALVMLDFLDSVAGAALRGDLDLDQVVEGAGGSMVANYDILEGYIRAERERSGRPRLYKRLEQFVARYRNSKLIH